MSEERLTKAAQSVAKRIGWTRPYIDVPQWMDKVFVPSLWDVYVDQLRSGQYDQLLVKLDRLKEHEEKTAAQHVDAARWVSPDFVDTWLSRN